MYRIFGRPTTPERYVPANAFAIAIRDGRYDVAKHLVENFAFDRRILTRTFIDVGFVAARARANGPRADGPCEDPTVGAAADRDARDASVQALVAALSKALK
jgi:hypothetical protein